MTVFAINKDLGFEEDDFKDLVDKKKKKLTELERALICLETEKLNLQKKIESLICNNNDLENELKAANNKKKIIEQELVKTEDKTQKQQAVIDELLQKLKQCDPGKIKKEHAKVKIKLFFKDNALQSESGKKYGKAEKYHKNGKTDEFVQYSCYKFLVPVFRIFSTVIFLRVLRSFEFPVLFFRKRIHNASLLKIHPDLLIFHKFLLFTIP